MGFGVVIFTNPDTVAHTYTSGTPEGGPDGVFDSGLVVAGASYEWTPTTVGEQPYLCIIHPWMKGVIIVQGNNGWYDGYDNGYNNGYNNGYDDGYRLEIKKTVVTWTFKDSKGNQYGIEWPVKAYEDIKSYSDQKSLNQDIIRLSTNNGNIISSISFEGFVRGDTFDCCIDELYDNSKSNGDFIYEIWGIVSQMTVYDEDLDPESEGRFALETIHRGGGDCEDLVILIAELIKSSSYTKNWDIQYVYMDSNNPTNPQTVNHVILSVNDGADNYLIEATGSPDYYYFPDGVIGWYFDV